MSERNRRRLLRKAKKKVQSGMKSMGLLDTDTDKTMLVELVGRMAEEGSTILASLRAAVGDEPSSGHVIDGIMTAARNMEMAALSGNPKVFADAVVVQLFLARHLAIAQGKIQVVGPPPAQA